MRRTRLTALLAFVVFALPCLAQTPFVFSVSNSASYSPVIAQGSLFVVFGFTLGPSQLTKATAYPLSLQLAGTSVSVVAGGNTFNCPMIYTSFGQVAAILPSNTPAGSALLRVTFNGRASFAESIQVGAAAFGIYSVNSSGAGPGVFTSAEYAAKSFDSPAHPREILILWGTGLGPISGADAVAPPTTPFPGVEVFVGNIPAPVTYAGRSGCCAGVDQIAFEVPNTVAGCFVPVAVRSGGVVSNFVTLAIHASGPCADTPPGPLTQFMSAAVAGKPLKVGTIALGPVGTLQTAGFSFTQRIAQRLSALLHVQVPEVDVKTMANAYRTTNTRELRQLVSKYGITAGQITGEVRQVLKSAAAIDQLGAAAAFGAFRNLAEIFPQLASNFPTAGTCTVTTGFPQQRAESAGLDAGALLTVNGPLGRVVLQRISNGQYLSNGDFQSGTLPAGTYTVAGTGGADIPPFTTQLNIPTVLAWTNKSAVASVDRAQPLTFTWTTGSGGFVLIGGAADDQNAIFLCVEENGKGSFTVPPFVLSALPAGSWTLFVAPHPFSSAVPIPGLDLAYIINGSSDNQTADAR
jgi:uncharacterized protein (TIGR03437 family)